MASLRGVLASLTNEDGSPDIRARRQQLNSLMSQLLSSELRYVKEYLCALTWTVDFIPQLPVEVVICITDYMTLKDFSITQMVSKLWNRCFTRPDIIDHLARKHFRMAYETSFKTATPSARLKLFNSLSCRRNAINQGSYQSMACFSYGASDTSESVRHSNENRIAWTSNEMIFVRNLISGETKRFVTPERHRVTGLCLRNDCLLAVCASSELHAWSVANGKMHRIRLPSIPVFFDTNRGNVLVSFKDGNMLKWAIGQSAKLLNIPVLPTEAIIFVGCDTLSEDTFIRCFLQLVNKATNKAARSGSPEKTLRLVAEKFTDDCILSCSFVDVPLSEEGRIAFEDRPSETIHKMLRGTGLDENGHYSVTVLKRFTKTEKCAGFPESAGHSSDSCSCSCSFLRVCYSAVEDRWRTDTYAIPSTTILGALTGPIEIGSIYFTENRALIPVIPEEDLRDSTNDLFVVGIEPCVEGISQDQITMRLRCISGSDGKSVVHRELIPHPDMFAKQKAGPFFHNTGLRYAWDREGIQGPVILRTGHKEGQNNHMGLPFPGK